MQFARFTNVGDDDNPKWKPWLKENELCASLNVEQANYILKPENWNKKSVIEFRTDFLRIKNDSENNGCIVYLNSENTSICDHSKLNG